VNKTTDQMKAALVALVRAALPTIDYYALYRARVVKQSGDRANVDLAPEDKRLPPGMNDVPIKLGIPGATVKFAPGAQMLVGWEGGDPSRPYALAWEGGATVAVLSITAAKVELGGEGLQAPLDGVVRAETPCQFTKAPHFVSGKTSLTVMAKL
jgi:hypothetical protein